MFRSLLVVASLLLGVFAATGCSGGSASTPTSPSLPPAVISYVTLHDLVYVRLQVNNPAAAHRQPILLIQYYNQPNALVECVMQPAGENRFVCPEFPNVPANADGGVAEHKVWVSDAARFDTRSGAPFSVLVANEIWVNGAKLQYFGQSPAPEYAMIRVDGSGNVSQ